MNVPYAIDDSWDIGYNEYSCDCLETFDIVILAKYGDHRHSGEGIVADVRLDRAGPVNDEIHGHNRQIYQIEFRVGQKPRPLTKRTKYTALKNKSRHKPLNKSGFPQKSFSSHSFKESNIPKLSRDFGELEGFKGAHLLRPVKSLISLNKRSEYGKFHSEIKNTKIDADELTWLKHLRPPSKSWCFEMGDEALVRSLKFKPKQLKGDLDSLEMDSLVVSYDIENLCDIEGDKPKPALDDNDEYSEGSSAPYDPLYECAFQFAKEHGFGFVEFVDTPDSANLDAERVKRARWRRRQSRRAREEPVIHAGKFSERSRHPVKLNVKAFSSHLKLGAVTKRGLCGGRPRHAEMYCRETDCMSFVSKVARDMDEVDKLSREVLDAISFDTWQQLFTKPEENHTQSPTDRRKSKSISPKRSKPNISVQEKSSRTTKTSPPLIFMSLPTSCCDLRLQRKTRQQSIDDHSKRSQYSPVGNDRDSKPPTSSSVRARLSSAKSSLAAPKNEIENHIQSKGKGALTLTRRRSKQRVCQKGKSLLNVNNKERIDIEDIDLWQVSQPATEYRLLVREMCNNMANGLLPMFLTKELEDTPPNNSYGLFSSEVKSDDGSTKEIENKNMTTCEFNNRPVSDPLATCKNEVPKYVSFIPLKGQSKTTREYRLFNSMSATLLRETEKSHKEHNLIETTPVEVVHIGHVKEQNAKVQFYSKLCDGSQDNVLLSQPYTSDVEISGHNEQDTYTRENAHHACSGETAARESNKRTSLRSAATTQCARNKLSLKSTSPPSGCLVLPNCGHLIGRPRIKIDRFPNLKPSKVIHRTSLCPLKQPRQSPPCARSLIVGDSPLHLTTEGNRHEPDVLSPDNGDCKDPNQPGRPKSVDSGSLITVYSRITRPLKSRPRSPRRKSCSPKQSSLVLKPLKPTDFLSQTRCPYNQNFENFSTNKLVADNGNNPCLAIASKQVTEDTDCNNNSSDNNIQGEIYPPTRSTSSSQSLTKCELHSSLYSWAVSQHALNSYNNNAIQAPEDHNSTTCLPNISKSHSRRQWAEIRDPPRYAECCCEGEENCTCQHDSSSTNDPVKLPTLPSQQKGTVSPENNKECEKYITLPTPPGLPGGSHKNAFDKHECTIVGFGASVSLDYEDKVEGFEIQTHRGSSRRITFPSTQSVQERPPKLVTGACNAKPKGRGLRDHPLNKSYVISRDGPDGENLLKLPVATPERTPQASPKASSSISKLELPPCNKNCCVVKQSYQPKPYICSSSPEFAGGRHEKSEDALKKCCRRYPQMNHATKSDYKNLNNNSLEKDVTECIYNEEDLPLLDIFQANEPSSRCLTKHAPHTFFAIYLSSQTNVSEGPTNLTRKYNNLCNKNTSNNNLFRDDKTDDGINSNQTPSVTTPREEQLRAIETELSSLVNEQPRIREYYEENGDDYERFHDGFAYYALNASTTAKEQHPWQDVEISNSQINVNNARSINSTSAREAEYNRRRCITSRSPPIGSNVLSLPQETNTGTEMEVDAPIVWDNMMTPSPTSRRLWSCENEPQRQPMQQDLQYYDPSVRLPNGVPYCPTTEDYWQMASNVSEINPTLSIFEPTSAPPQMEQGCRGPSTNHSHQIPHINNCHYENFATPHGGVDSSCEVREGQQGAESNDPSDSSNWTELYQRLEELWQRSQRYVNQRIDVMTVSMISRLKQLQAYLENNLTGVLQDRSERNDYVTDNCASHLNESAGQKPGPSHGFLHEMLSTRQEDPVFNKGKTVKNYGALNPTIGEKETKGKSRRSASFASKQIYFEDTDTKKTAKRKKGRRGTKKGRRGIATYKSIRQWKQEVSNPVPKRCALKHGSSTCICRQRHSRRCRRRGGVNGNGCNLCMMAKAKTIESKGIFGNNINEKSDKSYTKTVTRKPITKKLARKETKSVSRHKFFRKRRSGKTGITKAGIKNRKRDRVKKGTDLYPAKLKSKSKNFISKKSKTKKLKKHHRFVLKKISRRPRKIQAQGKPKLHVKHKNLRRTKTKAKRLVKRRKIPLKAMITKHRRAFSTKGRHSTKAVYKHIGKKTKSLSSTENLIKTPASHRPRHMKLSNAKQGTDADARNSKPQFRCKKRAPRAHLSRKTNTSKRLANKGKTRQSRKGFSRKHRSKHSKDVRKKLIKLRRNAPAVNRNKNNTKHLNKNTNRGRISKTGGKKIIKKRCQMRRLRFKNLLCNKAPPGIKKAFIYSSKFPKSYKKRSFVHRKKSPCLYETFRITKIGLQSIIKKLKMKNKRLESRLIPETGNCVDDLTNRFRCFVKGWPQHKLAGLFRILNSTNNPDTSHRDRLRVSSQGRYLQSTCIQHSHQRARSGKEVGVYRLKSSTSCPKCRYHCQAPFQEQNSHETNVCRRKLLQKQPRVVHFYQTNDSPQRPQRNASLDAVDYSLGYFDSPPYEDSVCDRAPIFSNNDKGVFGSNCRPVKIDSIELHQRRLMNKATDVSRNACLCETNNFTMASEAGPSNGMYYDFPHGSGTTKLSPCSSHFNTWGCDIFGSNSQCPRDSLVGLSVNHRTRPIDNNRYIGKSIFCTCTCNYCHNEKAAKQRRVIIKDQAPHKSSLGRTERFLTANKPTIEDVPSPIACCVSDDNVSGHNVLEPFFCRAGNLCVGTQTQSKQSLSGIGGLKTVYRQEEARSNHCSSSENPDEDSENNEPSIAYASTIAFRSFSLQGQNVAENISSEENQYPYTTPNTETNEMTLCEKRKFKQRNEVEENEKQLPEVLKRTSENLAPIYNSERVIVNKCEDRENESNSAHACGTLSLRSCTFKTTHSYIKDLTANDSYLTLKKNEKDEPNRVMKLEENANKELQILEAANKEENILETAQNGDENIDVSPQTEQPLSITRFPTLTIRFKPQAIIPHDQSPIQIGESELNVMTKIDEQQQEGRLDNAPEAPSRFATGTFNASGSNENFPSRHPTSSASSANPATVTVKNLSCEISHRLNDGTISADRVPQQPYLHVHCPGLSTTWTYSVLADHYETIKDNVLRYQAQTSEPTEGMDVSCNHRASIGKDEVGLYRENFLTYREQPQRSFSYSSCSTMQSSGENNNNAIEICMSSQDTLRVNLNESIRSSETMRKSDTTPNTVYGTSGWSQLQTVLNAGAIGSSHTSQLPQTLTADKSSLQNETCSFGTVENTFLTQKYSEANEIVAGKSVKKPIDPHTIPRSTISSGESAFPLKSTCYEMAETYDLNSIYSPSLTPLEPSQPHGSNSKESFCSQPNVIEPNNKRSFRPVVLAKSTQSFVTSYHATFKHEARCFTTSSINRPLPSLHSSTVIPCCIQRTHMLGKRKRRLAFPYSDSMTPPRKIFKMDSRKQPIYKSAKIRLERRARWQLRRELRFLASREQKRLIKLAAEQNRLQVRALVGTTELISWDDQPSTSEQCHCHLPDVTVTLSGCSKNNRHSSDADNESD